METTIIIMHCAIYSGPPSMAMIWFCLSRAKLEFRTYCTKVLRYSWIQSKSTNSTQCRALQVTRQLVRLFTKKMKSATRHLPRLMKMTKIKKSRQKLRPFLANVFKNAFIHVICAGYIINVILDVHDASMSRLRGTFSRS